ncbi:MAG TPA: FecR domain-containing protein [Sphingobium sp.]
MTVPQDRMMIETAALEWIVRQRDPDFDDWDGFTAWLEADASHADAYQAMAVADEDMAPLVQAALPVPANDEGAPAHKGRRTWIGGAIAAALVAAIGIGVMLPRADPWQVETRPGERREIALADGSRIILNGGTRILLDRDAPRTAVLVEGEALFVVRHDESDPFEVQAGSAHLVDVGTAFNVLRTAATLDVAVSEGAVVYNPRGEAARIDAGRRLHLVEGDGRFVLSSIDTGAVAGWREGRLVYDGQPLATVASDLARYYGVPIKVAPAIGQRVFRGVLTLPPKGAIATLAPVLDVDMRTSGNGWIVSPRS